MKKIICFITLLLLSNVCLAAGSSGNDDSKDSLYKGAKKLILKAKKLEKKDKIDKALKLYSKAYDKLVKAYEKDKIMPRYAELIYNGFWFSKERLSLQKIVDQKRFKVQGEIALKLYKGNVSIIGRKSTKSIYSMKKSSFESGKIFSRKYVENFIKVTAKKLRK